MFPVHTENQDDQKRAELDQADAQSTELALYEILPPVWIRLFNNLKVEGFTELQAMKILQTYILATNSK